MHTIGAQRAALPAQRPAIPARCRSLKLSVRSAAQEGRNAADDSVTDVAKKNASVLLGAVAAASLVSDG